MSRTPTEESFFKNACILSFTAFPPLKKHNAEIIDENHQIARSVYYKTKAGTEIILFPLAKKR
jgi:hypothetical protein